MPSLLTLLLLGAASLAAQTASGAAPQIQRDTVVITEVSDDPAAVSGVMAFAVELSGTTNDVSRSYYITFLSIGQAKPSVGQVCEVHWEWHDGFTCTQ
jgi:hypothetical protein